MSTIKIIRVFKVIHKRHKKQNWIWKRLHQAKMFVCHHDSIEPLPRDELSYMLDDTYGVCIHCEALCDIEVSRD